MTHEHFSYEKFKERDTEITFEKILRLISGFGSAKEELEKQKFFKKEKSDPNSVAEAVRDDGEKEKEMEEQNAETNRNVRSIKVSQAIADFLYFYGSDERERKKTIPEIWKNIRKFFSSFAEADNFIGGIIGVNTAINALETWGYEVRYARPVEDALEAVDLYANHPDFKRAYFVIQLKSSSNIKKIQAFSKIPVFTFNISEEKADDIINETNRLDNYVSVLNASYPDDEFYKVYLTVPLPAADDELDQLTGMPSDKLLNKLAEHDIIREEIFGKRLSN